MKVRLVSLVLWIKVCNSIIGSSCGVAAVLPGMGWASTCGTVESGGTREALDEVWLEWVLGIVKGSGILDGGFNKVL